MKYFFISQLEGFTKSFSIIQANNSEEAFKKAMDYYINFYGDGDGECTATDMKSFYVHFKHHRRLYISILGEYTQEQIKQFLWAHSLLPV